MPGILPMKVIKVGSNAQTRIAQACDRCRSKKIRCDGIRPSCTQCTNVGFECKTSDKLSRRAFPRGYTESLEERVRALESEVRELKDLLDEKDEKIDMLSRLHSHSSPSSVHSRATPSQSPLSSIENKEESVEKDDGFKVQQSPLLLDDENCDSYFIGNSSGRALVDAFKRKVQETGKPGADIQPEAFFHAGPRASEPSKTQQSRIVSFKAPPRLVSDQLINIFFQEWAPLFPIVHRPTFLALYEQYVASPETMEDKKSIATLNLVFSIAALSNDTRDTQNIESFDTQWRAAMETFLMDNSLAALQCFVLAQISCLLSADYPRLLKFKGLAISLSYRLGLHQSQKRFALGALTMETRKKVFWTLYTVDCLSAAQLGVPRLIKEEDVQCEYPVDADDEYVTEKGFLPSLPGECTKISSALALFRLARVLSKVLSDIYPANASYEISFKTMNTLSEELDAWLDSLPNHLRLTFAQDKPSTNVTGSRSPVLSLVYHYTRTLIYRPAACANLGDRGSSATIALSSSCKHLVQIVELLDERKLSFSVALNRKELILLCGFGILFQLFGIDQESRLAQDCHRMTLAVNDLLERSAIPSIALAFRRVSYLMLSGRSEKRQSPPTSVSRHSSESSMHAPQEISQGAFRATQKHLKAIAQCFSPASMSRFTKSGNSHLDGNEMRRATVPNVPSGLGMHGNQSSVSISSIRSEPSMSPQSIQNSLRQLLSPRSSKRPTTQYKNVPNLDYLAFDARQHGLGYGLHNPDVKGEFSSSDWERLLGSLDNGQTNIFDSIYGGPTADALIEGTPMSASTDSHLTWSPELWNAAYDLMPPSHMPHAAAPPPQSVLSFSDESLTSGDDFAVDFSSVDSPSGGERTYPGIVMPELSPPMLGGMDGNFGL